MDLANRYRTDDSTIAERISHVLQWSVPAAGSGVQAKVENGLQTLSGQVEWDHQRAKIAQQVRHVAGIKGLVSLIVSRRAAPFPRI
ncbi:MAG: BON domain-containing protein [Burkholderiaceae bacterium]